MEALLVTVERVHLSEMRFSSESQERTILSGDLSEPVTVNVDVTFFLIQLKEVALDSEKLAL